MKLEFKVNFNNLTQSEKELVEVFRLKKFAKLIRLIPKTDSPGRLYLDCRRDDRYKSYLVDGLLTFKAGRFYAKAGSDDLTNALTEVAKRLRKAVIKAKSEHQT